MAPTRVQTGDAALGRVQDSVSEALRQATASNLSRGQLAAPATYLRKSAAIKAGQAAIVWDGSTGAITMPPAKALGDGVAQIVSVHNVGTGSVTLLPNARDTFSDGYSSVASVVLRPKSSALLVSDGATAWACPLPGSLAATTVTVTATATLTRGQQVIVYTGSAGTLTLPAANAYGDGTAHFVYVLHAGSGTLTVQRAGADTIAIEGASSTSFVLAPSESAAIWADGGTRWALSAGVPGSAAENFRHVSGGSSLSNGYLANCVNATALTTTGTGIGDIMMAMPFIAPRRGGTIDLIGVEVTTGGATGVVRCGVYANVDNETDNLYPGALLASGAEQTATGTGIKSAAISLTLSPGRLYWLGCIVNNNNPALRALAPDACSHILGISGATLTVPNCGISVAHSWVSGQALPDPFPASGAYITAQPIPAIFARFSA